MLITSALYKSILANPAHRIEWKIENGAEVILSDRIVSGSIEGSIFEDLGIGNAISGRLVLKLRDVTLSPSSPLLLYFRAALEDSASEWIQRGVYYIDTIKTQPYSSDVDFIKALEDEYVSKSDIVHELMNEFDLEQSQAVLVVKRYLREKSDWEDDYKEDIVPDDDYGDGNKEY